MYCKSKDYPPPPHTLACDSQVVENSGVAGSDVVKSQFNYKINNLNLIRLFAALQVVIGHFFHWEYISLFNGVPIFFTLSGFLIYWSFDNNPNLKDYFWNRFLRIYPALVCALLFVIGLLLCFKILNISEIANPSFIMWIGTQLTFIQEFTPSIITGYGGQNAPNPVLWTISVEFLLYLIIPILYLIIKGKKRWIKTLIITLIGLFSYIVYNQLSMGSVISGLVDNGYYQIFINPFNQFGGMLFFFCIGILIYLYKDKVLPFLSGKAMPLLMIYIVISIVFYKFGLEPGSYSPNFLELLLHFLLVASTFSCAYTAPELSCKILGRTDVSYGIYIYHMPIILAFTEMEYTRTILNFIFILPIILVISWLSWIFIESKAMKYKHKSLIAKE